MTSKEIRQQFLDFFKSKNHRIVTSAPVVPYDDPTLLFTNAGMNQFKDVFLGAGTRDYKRAADTQKCIRVSGKHNDLEEVGYDTYHHTFFEMLGNWSFGDYYKKEAIEWAWELLTVIWKLPKERLFATVYKNDDEAYNLWKNNTDINLAHILRFAEKDNFWEMGETGPCGPCSEIHINLSADPDDASLVNAGSPKCIEIWNLVFIQYNRDTEGTLHELPAKHVDTGMGFERICAVLQQKKSNYDTDVFSPIIDAIAKFSNIKYEKEENMIAMRVIADHIRTLTFAIGDGAAPGNEGRGYVLRRILRRAARYGRKLNMKEPFLYKLVEVVVENMGYVFPEVKANRANIEKIIKGEEESFNATLDRGIDLFEGVVKKLKEQKKKVIAGEDVFKLYDTYGFPVDLTAVMAREAGFEIDEAGFNTLMNEQKDRARKSTKEKISSAHAVADNLDAYELLNDNPTIFTGYDELTTEAKITGVKNEEVQSFLILDKTPFYAESGGQCSDGGTIAHNGIMFNVIDLAKVNNMVIHIVENPDKFEFKTGMMVRPVVDEVRRMDTMRNHSATHLLHAALRNVLGKHVQQSGSYVAHDRLRFDFTHFQKVTEEELKEIESIVNNKIRQNVDLNHFRNTPFEEAKKMGALMFFGDKYGDKVNVVKFGDYSMEFCGGVHVKNTSQIGLFKIVSEASIASGVRRIEAVTGAGVEKFIEAQELKLKQQDDKINEYIEEKKKLEKELAEFKLKEKLGVLDSIMESVKAVNGVNIYKGKVNASNMDEILAMAGSLRTKIKSGAGLLISVVEDKVLIAVTISDDLIKDKKLSAGKIAGETAKIVGGGGGGRPQIATAGGKDISKADDALAAFDKMF